MEKTKDDLYKIIIEQQERNIDAFNGVKNALQSINDFNILHASKDEANYDVIREIVSSNKAVLSMFRWVIMTIVLALIVLAGAEKVLSFIKII